MTHEAFLERAAYARRPVGTQMTLIALLLAAIVALSLSDPQTPSDPQNQTAEPAVEDWHGNVRRSNGPY